MTKKELLDKIIEKLELAYDDEDKNFVKLGLGLSVSHLTEQAESLGKMKGIADALSIVRDFWVRFLLSEEE